MADKKISQLTASTTPLAGTEELAVVQSGDTKKVSVADLTAGRSTALGNKSTVGSSAVFPFITTNGMQIGTDDDSATRLTIGNQNTGASAASGIGFESAGGGWQLDVPPDVSTFANPLIGKFNGTEKFRFRTDGSFAPIAGGGIDFSADGSAAGMTSELLDDYEEGTWTPSLGGDATYTNQSGSYTKIGNLVFVQGKIIVGAIGTGSQTTVSGLPFTVNNYGTGITGKGSIGYFLSIATSLASFTPDTNSGTDTFYFNGTTGATTTATNAPNIFADGTRVDFSLVYIAA